MMMRRRGPGLIRGVAATAVVAGTAGAVRHRQEQRWDRKEQEQYEQDMVAQQAYAQQAAAAAQPAVPDYNAELQQLAQLKNQGIITEEEFEAKKRQILGI
jgi:hypothetical protein